MFAKECVMYTALPKFKSYFYQILEIFAALAEKVFTQQNVITCFLFAYSNRTYASRIINK